MKKAKVVLDNGSQWPGMAFGHEGVAAGEFTVSTRMGGTLEQIADPRSHGRILAFTFPMLGNYGVTAKPGKAWPMGIIARELCENPSNYQCAGSLNEYLCHEKIPGISGVDTRQLMRTLRAGGARLGAIVTEEMPLDEALSLIQNHKASTPQMKEFSLEKKPGFAFSSLRVTVFDLGAGAALAEMINSAYGCAVHVVPYEHPPALPLEDADGFLLSDGFEGFQKSGGELIVKLANSGKPLFAFGAGLLALTNALGGTAESSLYPYGGGNQSLRELRTGRLMIATRYPGHTPKELPDGAAATYVNLHGGFIEGFSLQGKRVGGVLFDVLPQAGPHDPSFILKDFIYQTAEVAKLCP